MKIAVRKGDVKEMNKLNAELQKIKSAKEVSQVTGDAAVADGAAISEASDTEETIAEKMKIAVRKGDVKEMNKLNAELQKIKSAKEVSQVTGDAAVADGAATSGASDTEKTTACIGCTQETTTEVTTTTATTTTETTTETTTTETTTTETTTTTVTTTMTTTTITTTE